MSEFQEQLAKMRNGRGFIAALDQSGGSTPKALSQYGVAETAYKSEAEMFDLVHAMRTRILTDRAFDGDRILGAILFEMTMDREVDGMPTPSYLWERKKVVPFVKVDQGLDKQERGVQLMKPMPKLDELLKRAKSKGVFGTKMRSVIHEANEAGIQAVVDQQFELAKRILEAGLIPIVEPEVSIKAPDKAKAEKLLRERLLDALKKLGDDQEVIFKLTLPEEANFYEMLALSDKVVRVVALSGGYSRDEANRRLSENFGVIASFSRALVEDLNAEQSDEVFSAALDQTIDSIYRASVT